MRRTPIPALLLALAALLPGCGGSTETAAPIACPTVGLLGDGANLIRHRQGAVRDLTTLDFEARLTGFSGRCRPGRGDRAIEVTLSTQFGVERGAAADSRQVDLPWFVAVIDPEDGNRVLDRQGFVERLVFSRNETRATGASQPITLTLPVREGSRIAATQVLVSFQLSPEELAVNRARGPR